MIIDVMVPCGKNSEEYFPFFLNSLESLSSGNHTLNFLLGINDYSVDIKSFDHIESNFNIKLFDCITSSTGGNGHGECLDLLLGKVENEIGLVCDVDTVVLKKDWDDMLVRGLNSDEKIAMIGTEYDRTNKKLMNFPNAVFTMFKVKPLLDFDVTFKPIGSGKRIIIDEQNFEIFGKQIGDEIVLDVSANVCYSLKTNGYDGIALPLKSPRCGDDCIFITSDMRGEEHLLDGVPIISHIGRGSVRGFDHPVTVKWRERYDQWITEGMYL